MDHFNRISVATLRDPEFINITSISPLVSKCEIKVLYVGENRNMSVISKEVATQMAQTLPGTPIVGMWIDKKEDFGDHGDRVTIDAEGIKFDNLTVPYGFVAPNSRVWFQEFQDTDEFGNTTIREYLMTEGYLWTQQYEECKRVLTNGNPQSMELDEDSLQGYWSMDNNRGIEFFIINDAIFSKLCILGEDVEPCFEGANVTAPQISSKFSVDAKFKNTLFSMMEELKSIISEEGGNEMENENITVETGIDNQVEDPTTGKDEPEVTVNESVPEENSTVEEPEQAEPETQTEPDENLGEDNQLNEPEIESNTEEFSKEQFELLQSENEALKTENASLKEELTGLREFKLQIDNEKKDALIDTFYMLSDEDKKDVIENKAQYSLEDIEAKLAIICYRKKVSFDLDGQENEVPTTYNLNDISVSVDDAPEWIKQVEARRNK